MGRASVPHHREQEWQHRAHRVEEEQADVIRDRDGGVGTLCSGGADVSSLAALARRRMEDVLRSFPRTTLIYDSTGAYRMLLNIRGLHPHCRPTVFVDDMPSSIDVIALYQPKDLRAVELYDGQSIMPERYQMFPGKEFACTVMLFWSKSARG